MPRETKWRYALGLASVVTELCKRRAFVDTTRKSSCKCSLPCADESSQHRICQLVVKKNERR
ncbi:MAG: hypothetical protein D6741_06945 [Planctomycetota bacterium]|nr:MAG: hypothetical protein D6741_06945 [Planctomycetota bacterium]